MSSPIVRFFAFEHLPQHLRGISAMIGKVAMELDDTLPDCEEKQVGLRKLLEAKDAFVRAKLG